MYISFVNIAVVVIALLLFVLTHYHCQYNTKLDQYMQPRDNTQHGK